jgi:hypothetical protein
MTAALIFRRQLVRHSALYLQQAPRASKLPLEKFHRLLDQLFEGGTSKNINTVSNRLKSFLYNTSRHLFIFCFVFIPGITQTLLPAAPVNSGCRGRGGGGHRPATPGPRFHQSLSSVSCVSKLLLSAGKGTP